MEESLKFTTPNTNVRVIGRIEMFKLHEKAIENINDSANSLIHTIEKITLPETQTKSCGNDLYSSATLTDKDILNMKFSLSNGLGEEVCKYFFHNNIAYGFIDQSYQTFCSVAQKIYKNKNISQIIGFKYLEEKLFLWIQNKNLGNEPNNFYDYLSNICKADVTEYKIIIPVPFTLSEDEFSLGKITYKTVTEKTIDDWFKHANKDNIKMNDEQGQKIKEFKIRIQKEIQGYIAGNFVCTAEISRAKELAYANFSNSLSVLRLLSFANLNYKADCTTHEFGQSLAQGITYLSLDSKTLAISYHSESLNKTLLWKIDKETINYIANGPFKKAHELLLLDSLNNFQEKLLNAIIIYSKNTISREIYDKILYILVAMESMLLKTDSETIQQNIGQRLSYLIGKGLEDRKNIIKTIKGIYSIRSKYIHHGIIDFKDDELMLRFMNYAWLAFSNMIISMDKFNTKESFIEYLDNLMLS